MSYAAVAEERVGAAATAQVSIPADIGWEMLDKSRFFFLGAALFSAVSAALHPAVVLKTRLQVASASTSPPALRTAAAILTREGPRGFYRGFGTSLTGTIPARALYMAALEVTRSGVGSGAARLGVPDATAAAVANAAAGISSAVAAQVVWTPIDVVSQRLMVQQHPVPATHGLTSGSAYRGGVDAFRKIFRADGLRGLYRGFGVSILTYAPSNAVWWSTYSLTQRLIWAGLLRGKDPDRAPGGKTIVAVQGISAATAGGLSAIVTMPLDTIKTRMQVLDDGGGGRANSSSGSGIVGAVRSMAREGGSWRACYRGLGPRWASMSLSAATMVTTYEFLKRKSAKGAGDCEEY